MSDLSFFTADKLQKCVTENQKIEVWHPVFLDYFPKYGITTPERIAGFLSQTCVECTYWQKFSENLNYSVKGLRTTFPKYFPTDALANAYARQPEKIANRVYANRMGNGDEASGDGWLYRGRGAIQCTGKSNYIEFSRWLYGIDEPILKNPAYLTTTDGVILSAIWYWTEHGLNELADKKDVLGMTKRINGGTKGLPVRTALHTRMMKVLTNDH